jgi:N4-gp56 family major capsid protein
MDGVTAVAGADDSAGAGRATITVTGSLVFKVASQAKANAITALNVGASSHQGSGNMYGSSKDIGYISGKLPLLGENGGRVNRVGFKRIEIEGTFEKFGFFDEYTQESLDFDTDEQLEEHVNREMIRGAGELTEDALQIDLLSAAGVIKYAGTATKKSDLDENCIVAYADLMHMGIDLDNNRTPKQTKVITGSRMVDTKTVAGGRIAYIGSELLPVFERMVDLHNERAYIPVQKYADAGNVVRGEQGAAGPFRLVVVPEMMKWAGAGAIADDATVLSTGGRYDVFPILVVGDESFTTIGFQTDGKTVKFKVIHKKPGEVTADRNEPYGETGFMSIKWYYGFMALRPERIGLILTVAKL